jgi:GTP pyrophosphokinase
MKSHAVEPSSQADTGAPGAPLTSQFNTASIVTATADGLPEQPQALARARAFAEPLIASETLDTGENILAHADAVAAILKVIGGSEAMQAATYLVYACQHLNKPQEVIAKAFGANYAALAVETTKLVQVQRQARSAGAHAQLHDHAAAQTENVRKMLLAFSRDLRVVMLRLASRLQTLRYFASVMCLRHWPTGWEYGKSSGKWKIWHFVFLSPKLTRKWPACFMKSVPSEKSLWRRCGPSWRVN